MHPTESIETAACNVRPRFRSAWWRLVMSCEESLAAQCRSTAPSWIYAHDKQMIDIANRLFAVLNCGTMAADKKSALLTHGRQVHVEMQVVGNVYMCTYMIVLHTATICFIICTLASSKEIAKSFVFLLPRATILSGSAYMLAAAAHISAASRQ